MNKKVRSILSQLNQIITSFVMHCYYVLKKIDVIFKLVFKYKQN